MMGAHVRSHCNKLLPTHNMNKEEYLESWKKMNKRDE